MGHTSVTEGTVDYEVAEDTVIQSIGCGLWIRPTRLENHLEYVRGDLLR